MSNLGVLGKSEKMENIADQKFFKVLQEKIVEFGSLQSTIWNKIRQCNIQCPKCNIISNNWRNNGAGGVASTPKHYQLKCGNCDKTTQMANLIQITLTSESAKSNQEEAETLDWARKLIERYMVEFRNAKDEAGPTQITKGKKEELHATGSKRIRIDADQPSVALSWAKAAGKTSVAQTSDSNNEEMNELRATVKQQAQQIADLQRQVWDLLKVINGENMPRTNKEKDSILVGKKEANWSQVVGANFVGTSKPRPVQVISANAKNENANATNVKISDSDWNTVGKKRSNNTSTKRGLTSKATVKRMAARALKPVTEPVEFEKIQFKVGSSAFKKQPNHVKNKVMWQILKNLKVNKEVFLASRIGNSILEIYVTKSAVEKVEALLQASEVEIVELDTFTNPTFGKTKNDEPIISRLAMLVNKAKLVKLKECVLRNVSAENVEKIKKRINMENMRFGAVVTKFVGMPGGIFDPKNNSAAINGEWGSSTSWDDNDKDEMVSSE